MPTKRLIASILGVGQPSSQFLEDPRNVDSRSKISRILKFYMLMDSFPRAPWCLGGARTFRATQSLGLPKKKTRSIHVHIAFLGMTSAAFTIIWMKIIIEWHSIVFCSLGAAAGIVFGFHVLDPLMTGEMIIELIRFEVDLNMSMIC